MARMSILHVAQPIDSGVPHAVIGMVRDQVARGWDVAVACPPESDAHLAAIDAGGRYFAWPADRLPGRATRSEARLLAGIIARVGPNVVHLHSSKAGLAGRFALRGSRATVFQPHGWSFLATEGLLLTATAAWERFAARWACAIVCVSEAEQRVGAEARIGARFVLARQGVDLQRYSPQGADARRLARVRLGVPEDAPLAICVGRLSRQKGQDALLRAWPLVRAEIAEAQLTLVGDGPDRTVLERQAVAGVRFAGSSTDVVGWLAAADVVVLPSRWEGLSFLLLEALACGRCVVTTDVAGMREVVQDDAGAVVAVGDEGALAAAVSARLRDRALADREGRAGRAMVEHRHDLLEQHRTIAALYADLIASR